MLIISDGADNGWSVDNLTNLPPNWTNKKRNSYLPESMATANRNDLILEIPPAYYDNFVNSYDPYEGRVFTAQMKSAVIDKDLSIDQTEYYGWPQMGYNGYHAASILYNQVGGLGCSLSYGDQRSQSFHEAMNAETGSSAPFYRKQFVEYDEATSGTTNGSGVGAYLDDWTTLPIFDGYKPQRSWLRGSFNYTSCYSKLYLREDHNPQEGVAIEGQIIINRYEQEWLYYTLVSEVAGPIRKLGGYKVAPIDPVSVDFSYIFMRDDNPLVAPNYGQRVHNTRVVDLEEITRFRKHATLGWMTIQRKVVDSIEFKITSVAGRPFYYLT